MLAATAALLPAAMAAVAVSAAVVTASAAAVAHSFFPTKSVVVPSSIDAPLGHAPAGHNDGGLCALLSSNMLVAVAVVVERGRETERHRQKEADRQTE